MKKYLLLFIALLGLDVVTKYLVQYKMSSVEIISILDNFLGGITLNIVKVYNSGAALGLLKDYPIVLLFFRIILISSAIIYAIKASHEIKLFLTILIAGAMGNVIDCLIYGHVIDFIHFIFWGISFPIFNFADAFITISVILILATTKNRHVSF